MPGRSLRKRKLPLQKPVMLNAAELQKLLGRPALLRGESAKNYDEIQTRLMECLTPRDFMEQMLISEYMCWSWEARRYSRHKALAIEAAVHQIAEFQAKRRVEQGKAEKARKNHRNDDEPATDFGRMCELENVVDSAVQDVDAILMGPHAELMNARALKATIESQFQLDRLLNDAIVRQYETLAQLERHRRGLGKRTEKACGDIIDAEFNDATQETDGQLVPLVPSTGNGR